MLCTNTFFNRFTINLWNVFFPAGDSLPYLFCRDLGYDKSLSSIGPPASHSQLPIGQTRKLHTRVHRQLHKILVCPNDSLTQAIAGDAAGIFKQIMGLNATPSLEFYPDDVKMVAAFQEKYSQIKGYLSFNNYSYISL